MARVAKSALAMQIFRGGLNKLSVWAKHIGGDCCDPKPDYSIDRLNPTINPENALVHTRPFGNRDYMQFSEFADSIRQEMVDWINASGVGAQLEILVIPTFSLLHTVELTVLAEEAGFTYSLSTRNGTVLPTGQLIQVDETEGGANCEGVARVQAVGAYTGLGVLAGATRRMTMGVSAIGGEFALEADVLILTVTALPAAGLKGTFDFRANINYVAPGRSEAQR